MGLSRVVWLSLVVHDRNTKTLALEASDAPPPPPTPFWLAGKGYPGAKRKKGGGGGGTDSKGRGCHKRKMF